MFGFWFSIYGLFFGSTCSVKAKGKNRFTKNWFTLGFVFGIFAYIVLISLPGENEESTMAMDLNGKVF
jgi:hypothetical protein